MQNCEFSSTGITLLYGNSSKNMKYIFSRTPFLANASGELILYTVFSLVVSCYVVLQSCCVVLSRVGFCWLVLLLVTFSRLYRKNGVFQQQLKEFIISLTNRLRKIVLILVFLLLTLNMQLPAGIIVDWLKKLFRKHASRCFPVMNNEDCYYIIRFFVSLVFLWSYNKNFNVSGNYKLYKTEEKNWSMLTDNGFFTL